MRTHTRAFAQHVIGIHGNNGTQREDERMHIFHVQIKGRHLSSKSIITTLDVWACIWVCMRTWVWVHIMWVYVGACACVVCVYVYVCVHILWVYVWAAVCVHEHVGTSTSYRIRHWIDRAAQLQLITLLPLCVRASMWINMYVCLCHTASDTEYEARSAGRSCAYLSISSGSSSTGS